MIRKQQDGFNTGLREFYIAWHCSSVVYLCVYKTILFVAYTCIVIYILYNILQKIKFYNETLYLSDINIYMY